LEIKFALDVANSLNSQIIYSEDEWGPQGMEMLRIEKKFDVIWPALKYWFTYNDSWFQEIQDIKKITVHHKLKDLTENFFNKDQMAWFERMSRKMFPEQTQAFLGRRSEDMFVSIERDLHGKKKMAVVNQWHIEGIERLWRKYHNIEIRRPATTGTEDLPLAEIQAYMRGTDHDRARVEKTTGYPMGMDGRQNVPYYDENRSHYG